MGVVNLTASAKRPLRSAKPSLLGLVCGELFKIRHQRITWVMLVLMVLAIILPYIMLVTTSNLSDQIYNDPKIFYNVLEIGLTALRVVSGFFLLILTARLIGLEYQLGTIRVLLARGVGRLQLLFTKLLAVVLVALTLLVIGLLFTTLLMIIVMAKASGNLDAFHMLPLQFWSDTWTFVLTIFVNMGATILLATATAAIGRASAFGLSAALAFFALDNAGALIMQLPFNLTNNNFWLDCTAYFLGPNLNDMPHALASKFDALGATPLYFVGSVGPMQTVQAHSTLESHGILVDGTHTLIVAAVYAVIFAAIAIWMTWKRDIQE